MLRYQAVLATTTEHTPSPMFFTFDEANLWSLRHRSQQSTSFIYAIMGWHIEMVYVLNDDRVWQGVTTC